MAVKSSSSMLHVHKSVSSRLAAQRDAPIDSHTPQRDTQRKRADVGPLGLVLTKRVGPLCRQSEAGLERRARSLQSKIGRLRAVEGDELRIRKAIVGGPARLVKLAALFE